MSEVTEPRLKRSTDTDTHPSRLRVVNLPRSTLPDLGELDVDEVDICKGKGHRLSCGRCRAWPGQACPPDPIRALTVSGSVNDREEEHRVCNLSMEPDVLVEGQEP